MLRWHFTPLFVAFVAATLLPTPAAQAQTTWYVDDDAPNDPGSGDPTISDPLEDGSAEHPFDAIKEGIDAATAGDTVLVLDGTYTGVGNRDLDFAGKAITLRSVNGAESCIIDCEDDGRGFYFHRGETNASVFSGFTIANGSVVGDCLGDLDLNGAVGLSDLAQLLANYGTTGGASYEDGDLDEDGDVDLADLAILLGAYGAVCGGGAIHCSGASPTITNCTLSGNAAVEGSGGGIFSGDSSPLIADCRFESCECTYQWDFEPAGGGAIYCVGGSPRIIANRFADCMAMVSCLHGGGAIGFRQSDILIQGNRIVDCFAHGMGGGIAGIESQVDISHNTIAGCQGFHYGGGIALENSSGILANNLIVGNVVPDRRGGGIYVLAESNVEIAFCTVANNVVAPDYSAGGGIWVDSAAAGFIHDCIFWGNDANEGEQIWPPDGLNVTYCDIQDGYVYPGDHNIDTDPLFVDPNGPDGDPNTWVDNDYHLAAGSPCIDAGDPNFIPEPDDRDIDGQWRVWDGNDDGDWRVDMGSDEFGSHCPGDLDGDDDIDVADLAALLANYGATSGMTPADGDSDLDGDVDLSDLSALLAVYGTTCD